MALIERLFDYLLQHHERIVCGRCERVIASCPCWEHTCERETHVVTCQRCASAKMAA
jgi:hypothetical protein